MASDARRHRASSARSSSNVAAFHAEQHGQRGGQEVAPTDAAQFFQIPVGQDRVRQLQRVAVLRRFIEDVALGSDVAGERHHQFFADRVDGRIGHLREQLLEVVEQRLRAVRETRQRRVGAHRSDRAPRPWSHGQHQHAQVLFGVAEGALAAQDGFVIAADDARRRGQLIQRDLVLLRAIRRRAVAPRAVLFSLLVGDDAALLRDRPAACGRAAGGPCS